MVVYTFLRTIVDHNPEQLHSLRQKETELCVGLLREKVSWRCYESFYVIAYDVKYIYGIYSGRNALSLAVT